MEQSGLWSAEVNGSEAFYAVVKVNNRGVMQSQKVMINQIK
jgi:hypothetical protein